MAHRAGFVTVVGRPNVGKSTLINSMLGEKIAITSPRPQTTRTNMRAIVSDKNYQLIFVDTPGIHSPKNKLGEYMTQAATSTFSEVDVIVFVADATDKKIPAADFTIIDDIKKSGKPAFLVINKTDAVEKEILLEKIAEYSAKMDFREVIPLSAKKNDGTKILLKLLVGCLPEGPALYDPDILTDKTVRELCAEIIREKILLFTTDEVPHGVGVEIVKYSEGSSDKATEIHANIYCEKESHKGILIGKNGDMLKRIGTAARKDMEPLSGGKVNLKLWVKVREDWRNSAGMLKELGFTKDRD